MKKTGNSAASRTVAPVAQRARTRRPAAKITTKRAPQPPAWQGLAAEHCVPCKAGEGRLSSQEAIHLLGELEDWVYYTDHIEKRLEYRNFALALLCVNQIAAVAEASGHHPDIQLGWGYVEVRLSTHSIGGLSRNDFIVAARIDAVTASR